MKEELKRALFKKSNLLMIAFVIIMMFINAYYAGWHTAISAPNAPDLHREEDVMFYVLRLGNTLKVWKDGTYLIPVLSPILLLIPYGLSLALDKENNYRYLMMSRLGRNRYLYNKVFAIVVSGVLMILVGEIIFYGLTWFMTVDVREARYLEYVAQTALYPKQFYENPYLYFAIHLLIKYILYISTAIFGIGIASNFSNKAGIISTPFIILVIGALLLPKTFVYDIALNNIFALDFNLNTLWINILCLNGIGLLSLYFSERNLYING